MAYDQRKADKTPLSDEEEQEIEAMFRHIPTDETGRSEYAELLKMIERKKKEFAKLEKEMKAKVKLQAS